MFSEQENELTVYKERTANADGYIEALRARLGKLAEREASAEVCYLIVSPRWGLRALIF